MTAREDRFCPDCGVSTNLHDGPDSCEAAEDRASAVEQMDRMFFGFAR